MPYEPPDINERIEAYRKQRRDDRELQRIIDSGHTPVIALRRPRCPSCGALNKTPTKSYTDGETVTQKRTCQECGLKFVTVCD